jgi:hypothetical protein
MNFRPILVALLTMGAILPILGTSTWAGEGTTLLEDDFEEQTGAPDPDKWIVHKTEAANYAYVVNGSLLFHVVEPDKVRAEANLDIIYDDFTVEFDWLQMAAEGTTLMFEVITRDEGSWKTEEWFYYEAEEWGWSFGDPSTNYDHHWHSYETNAENGTWYHVTVTVVRTELSFTVVQESPHKVMFTRTRFVDLRSNTRVRIGAGAGLYTLTSSMYDNFRIYDPREPGDMPIVVDPLPTILVMEDEETEIDLAPYVHDPDGNPNDVMVQTSDLTVIRISGKTITVVCLEDGGTQEVRLVFTDGTRTTVALLTLDITGVNDPPMVTIVMPSNLETFSEDDRIHLEYRITDPDSDNWQTQWTLQGLNNDHYEFRDVTVGSSMQHRDYLDNLDVGRYRIGVSVFDGQDDDTKWVDVEVLSEGPPEVETFDATGGALCASCLITLIVVGTPIGYIAYRARQQGRKLTDPVVGPRSVPPALRGTPRPAPADPLKVEQYQYRMPQASPTAPPQPRQPPPPLTPPPPRQPPQVPVPAPPPVYSTPSPPPVRAPPPSTVPPGAPPPPSAAPPGEWQVTSVEEFVDLIPRLPNGFPEPLWGIPWEKVGAEVVATSTVGRDGRPVCYVGGQAFHADKFDLDTFMQVAD